MLVLSRKLGEKIVIGDNIVITVVKIDRNQIRIGIEAPHDVPVYREEIAPQRDEIRGSGVGCFEPMIGIGVGCVLTSVQDGQRTEVSLRHWVAGDTGPGCRPRGPAPREPHRLLIHSQSLAPRVSPDISAWGVEWLGLPDPPMAGANARVPAPSWRRSEKNTRIGSPPRLRVSGMTGDERLGVGPGGV